MNKLVIVFLTWYLIFTQQCVKTLPFQIDFDIFSPQTGKSYFDTECVRVMQIDFYFNENSVGNCSTTNCSVQNKSQSVLQLFDKQLDEHWNLTLQEFQYTNWTFVKNRNSAQKWRTFVFKFSDNANKIYVLVPVLFRHALNQYVINLNNMDTQNEYQQFNSFKQLSSTRNPFQLSMFNFLNLLDFGLFYKISDIDKNSTVLLSKLVYEPIYNYQNEAIQSNIRNQSFDYAFSAGKACFGAQQTQDIFLTHLADNYTLWTGWVSFLFFWAYYLLTQRNTINCFDRKFQHNNWTSWSVYSLFYLGHDQFFSKLSRITNMTICSSFQALIISIVLQNMRGIPEHLVIAWAVPIALFSVQPISYFIGWLFMRRSYHKVIQRHQLIKKINHRNAYKNHLTLDEKFELYNQLYIHNQQIYSIFYLYYCFAILWIVVCWTVSVHIMQLTFRGDNILHPDWAISYVIGWFADVFILEPILAYCLGNKQFYRMRGYYYDFDLGKGYNINSSKSK